MKRGFPIAASLAALALVGSTTPSRADGIYISPLRATLVAPTRSAVFTLTNSNMVPETFHAHVYRWTQNAHGDSLAATDAALLSPPIFTVGPGQAQSIRIGLLTPPALDSETQYRVLIDEMPERAPVAGSILMVLHISVPIFVPPSNAAAAPAVVWSARRIDRQHIALSAVNRGAIHIQLISTMVSLDVAGGKPSKLGMFYLLPGAQRVFVITGTPPATFVRISASSDKGPLQASIPIGP